MAQPRLPFYFSVDFEDFVHDYRRYLGADDTPCSEAALRKSYERINVLSERYFDGRRMTFFVTGVLARAAPSLIRQISNDGHEVACHYNFHDRISERPRDELAPNLDAAIAAIETATGIRPVGFRAPSFGIDPCDDWAFEELAKRFLYDSSYRTSATRSDVAPDGTLTFGADRLHEFFVYGHPVLGGRFKLRTGGTFMRLFPARMTLEAMRNAHLKGHDALLYVHPYELLTDGEFWVPWKDIAPLPARNKLLRWARQVQWIKAGHRGMERKLAAVCKYFEHQGPMRDAVADLSGF